VYKLIARDTVEEKLVELQDRKRDVFAATIDSNRLAVDRLTRDDVAALFD